MSEKKGNIKDIFYKFLLQYYNSEILEILKDSSETDHLSLNIRFMLLLEEHVEIVEATLSEPIKVLRLFDSCLIKALNNLYEEKCNELSLLLKTNVHVRLIDVPRCRELHRHVIPLTADVGKLICLNGTVVRTGSPKILEYQKQYVCSKCKHTFVVDADYSQFYKFNKPYRCHNPEGCPSTVLKILSSSSPFSHSKDYQEIKIQEQAQKLVVGTIPRAIWVTLEDDLADSVKPGDDVIVCGVVLQRWHSLNVGCRPLVELSIKANSINVKNKQKAASFVTDNIIRKFKNFWNQYSSDPLAGRNVILSSFCPQVYGLFLVKLAAAVVVAGGIQQSDTNGTKTRGESHLLLVGDPGTGKSQILKYVSLLVPRCVLTTGIGTTSAGLTVSAVREEGEWTLEAGALVLADGGICCIDEFNSIKESDRCAIHEAMEQQTISVAKAGLVCKLNSRCSILAATNPKGRYDPDQSLQVNVALATPLLSRFDLIIVLLDTRNSKWDKFVSDFLLDLRMVKVKKDDSIWSLEHLQSYFYYVKTLQPKMSSDAQCILTRYYQLQRQTDLNNQARTTIRLLESLVRLSQGHARLMMREEVLAMDAIIAITMMEASMLRTSLVPGIDALHTEFPESPSEDYKNHAKIILESLGLLNIFTEEVNRLNADQKRYSEIKKEKTMKLNLSSKLLPDCNLSKAQEESIKRGMTQEPNYASSSKFEKSYNKKSSLSHSDTVNFTILENFLDASPPVPCEEVANRKRKYSDSECAILSSLSEDEFEWADKTENNFPSTSSETVDINSFRNDDIITSTKAPKKYIKTDASFTTNNILIQNEDVTEDFIEGKNLNSKIKENINLDSVNDKSADDSIHFSAFMSEQSLNSKVKENINLDSVNDRSADDSRYLATFMSGQSLNSKVKENINLDSFNDRSADDSRHLATFMSGRSLNSKVKENINLDSVNDKSADDSTHFAAFMNEQSSRESKKENQPDITAESTRKSTSDKLRKYSFQRKSTPKFSPSNI